MSVNDWVMQLIDASIEGVTAGRPLLGKVIAEAAGPPLTADVVWENGEEALLVPQAQLRKVFNAGDVNVKNAENVGKWVQLIGYPEVDLDGEGVVESDGGAPKSPAASGLVVRAWGIALYDAGAATQEWFVMTTEDGEGFLNMEFIDVFTPGVESDFVVNVQDGRRVV